MSHQNVYLYLTRPIVPVTSKKQIWCPVVAMAAYATTHATQLHDVGDTTYEQVRITKVTSDWSALQALFSKMDFVPKMKKMSIAIFIRHNYFRERFPGSKQKRDYFLELSVGMIPQEPKIMLNIMPRLNYRPIIGPPHQRPFSYTPITCQLLQDQLLV